MISRSAAAQSGRRHPLTSDIDLLSGLVIVTHGLVSEHMSPVTPTTTDRINTPAMCWPFDRAAVSPGWRRDRPPRLKPLGVSTDVSTAVQLSIASTQRVLVVPYQVQRQTLFGSMVNLSTIRSWSPRRALCGYGRDFSRRAVKPAIQSTKSACADSASNTVHANPDNPGATHPFPAQALV